MSAPRLLETMRAEGGRVALLDRHLDRLGASARAFSYPLDAAAARRRVEAVAAQAIAGSSVEASATGARALQESREAPAHVIHALRLILGPDGTLDLSARPLSEASFRTIWIDDEPLLQSGTWRCTVKTTDRDHYRVRFERARARGADEAVLVNDRGEITEGSRTNVWARIGGRWLTPALAAGGLGGVMRAHVLATRADIERARLTPADLRAADALALTNALRGWMPVRLVGTSGGRAG